METSYQENYIKQLHRLLHTVTKSQKKYIQASGQTESEDFKNIFSRIADERNAIIIELKNAIEKLGGQVTESEEQEISEANSTNSDVNSKKDQAILESLRGSEQGTLDTYDDVLQGSILEEFDLKTLIMGQRLVINEAYTELDRRYFELFKLSQPY